MSTISPHRPQSNTVNHLAQSHVGTSRSAIKTDLVDKIVYDDPAVFRRLRIDQVNRDFVAACAASFNAANAEDIKLLIKLVEQTSKKKTPEQLEIEETDDAANDQNKEERSGNHGSVEERKMYDPLECVVLSDCVFHVVTLINYRCAYSTS
jgi:hypothetical protein